MKKVYVVLVLFCAFLKMFADDGDKLRLAVMEFEDRSGEIPQKTLSDATEYLRGALISANKYIVIASERQSQAMVKDMKKESYKECNDKNCQIQLGQALSADTILRTTITRLGKTFVIASELIDLEKEATVVGAREKYDGTENSMSEALDNIAEKVISAYESIQHAENESEDRQPQQKTTQGSKDSRDCEQARQENSINAWRTYLRKHSKGECAEEAKENLDKMICEQAEDQNSLKAWENYAKEFPNGDCIIKAEANIKALKEDAKIEQYSKQEELLKSFYSSADERMDRKFTGRYNFGIATAFDTPNKFGISTGFDFNFNVFQKPIGGGAGNLFVGFGFDFEYYAPTEDLEYNTHLLEVPIMLNFGYDFRVNNYTLRYVGFWFSAGAGIDVFIWDSNDDDDWDDEGPDSKIYGSFAWELGFEMIFRSRFIMNFGFGGFAGEAYEYYDGSHFFFNIGTIF